MVQYEVETKSILQKLKRVKASRKLLMQKKQIFDIVFIKAC